MNTKKDTTEFQSTEEVASMVVVNNVKPAGFDTLICLEEGCLSVNFGGEAESWVLESLFAGFAADLHILPPLVLAKSTETQDLRLFEFRGCFAIRSSTSNWENLKNSFKIYIKNSWTGTDFTPEFLIDFDSKEGVSTDPFLICKIDFSMYFNVAPKTITTYVWNQDPEGSRGTETVVQSGG